MEALIALKSSHFRNNCESKSAAFGPFFLTWIHEIRSRNTAKDDLSFPYAELAICKKSMKMTFDSCLIRINLFCVVTAKRSRDGWLCVIAQCCMSLQVRACSE